MPSNRSSLRPRALRPGAHVRVIAPSSPFDMQDFARGVDRLRARYRVTYDEQIGARAGYLAGDDARRLRELEDAIGDPDVDCIVAARGGYGAMRIASSIDPARVAAQPKLLVGFSDVTALHALWARAGVCSLHASMVAALGRGSHAMLARWIESVEGAREHAFEGLAPIGASRDVVEAKVIGGNLALLAAMTGTPLAPPLDGAILFVEDVGEAPYRVDRMLTQLRLSGALARVAGVLVGTFTRCAASADGTTVETVIAERLGDLGVPVLTGLPCGHVDEPLELPLGARARIDGTRGCVTFVEPVVHL
ncbi:S66 peptidase family protein [Sandaracinus amylolyticus]|nr:LD-carboxypeptidase [Sandaracinus amylolyticus]